MSMLNFLGGLTGAYTNIKAGYQEAEKRRKDDEDRKFQLEQRDLERRKMKATTEEMDRQERLRTLNSQVSLDETVEVPDDATPATPVAPVKNGVAEVDGDASPVVIDPATGVSPQAKKTVTRRRPMEDVYRDYANNFKSVGDASGYLNMTNQAVQAAAQRASSQFTRIAAASAGKTPTQIAEELRTLYDTDILPGKVGKVTPHSDGVGIDIEFVDNETGQRLTQSFKDAGQLMTVAQSYFDPANYAKQVEARRAHMMKLEEERNKVHLVGPRTVAMRGDGQPLGTNAMYSRDYDNDGSGSGVGGGGGGGGGGSGRSSKAKSPLEQAKGIYWDSIGKADGSPEFAIRSTDGERLLEVLYEDLARENANRRPGEEVSLNPGTAASIVNRALNNPNAITYQIDKTTGLPTKVFSDKEVNGGKKYSLATNLPVEDMEKSVGLDGMKTAVTQMVDSIVSQAPNEQQAKALRDQMIKAASDPKERVRYIEAVKSAGGDVGAVSRQLDLVSKYIGGPGGGSGGDGFVGRLAGALGLSAPPAYSGMGSAFPQDARSRFEADTAKATPAATKAGSESKDRGVDSKRLRGELGEISIKTVSYLKPDEAKAILDKYRDVLNGPERSMLADKVADARYLRRN